MLAVVRQPCTTVVHTSNVSTNPMHAGYNQPWATRWHVAIFIKHLRVNWEKTLGLIYNKPENITISKYYGRLHIKFCICLHKLFSKIRTKTLREIFLIFTRRFMNIGHAPKLFQPYSLIMGNNTKNMHFLCFYQTDNFPSNNVILIIEGNEVLIRFELN